jgi:hypothetical protein
MSSSRFQMTRTGLPATWARRTASSTRSCGPPVPPMAAADDMPVAYDPGAVRLQEVRRRLPNRRSGTSIAQGHQGFREDQFIGELAEGVSAKHLKTFIAVNMLQERSIHRPQIHLRSGHDGLDQPGLLPLSERSTTCQVWK